jgi:hypothetical protein
MSMRVLEEKQRLVETNDGDWKKEMEERIDFIYDMMMSCQFGLYGIPTEDNMEQTDFHQNGITNEVKLLIEKVKRLEN